MKKKYKEIQRKRKKKVKCGRDRHEPHGQRNLAFAHVCFSCLLCSLYSKTNLSTNQSNVNVYVYIHEFGNIQFLPFFFVKHVTVESIAFYLEMITWTRICYNDGNQNMQNHYKLLIHDYSPIRLTITMGKMQNDK